MIGHWEDKADKQGKLVRRPAGSTKWNGAFLFVYDVLILHALSTAQPQVPIEYWNDTQIAGSKLPLDQVGKDESKQKPVTVLHPHEATPRNAEGRISDKATEADYQELNEWGKIEIEDGTIIQLTKTSKLTYVSSSFEDDTGSLY